MEEWGFVDERDLQNWKGGMVCMTCQHFAYGVDQHCHTMVGCNLRQKQLQQGQHLKKRCKLWSSALEIKSRKAIVNVKKFLVLFLLLCLCGCDRLADNEFKALKCELWRESGGALNQQIYRDIAHKNKCVITNDFRESLAIKGRKGISMPCDPEEQDALLLEVNLICDSLLNQNQSE